MNKLCDDELRSVLSFLNRKSCWAFFTSVCKRWQNLIESTSNTMRCLPPPPTFPFDNPTYVRKYASTITAFSVWDDDCTFTPHQQSIFLPHLKNLTFLATHHGGTHSTEEEPDVWIEVPPMNKTAFIVMVKSCLHKLRKMDVTFDNEIFQIQEHVVECFLECDTFPKIEYLNIMVECHQSESAMFAIELDEVISWVESVIWKLPKLKSVNFEIGLPDELEEWMEDKAYDIIRNVKYPDVKFRIVAFF